MHFLEKKIAHQKQEQKLEDSGSLSDYYARNDRLEAKIKDSILKKTTTQVPLSKASCTLESQ